MDEILIDEKKYVSSKQAAKITGYAKDYIGQLCREGRVPARLVGRSWYVLESAIQDHRFGGETPNKKDAEPAESKAEPTSWIQQSPRYNASLTDFLPTMRKKTEEVEPEESAAEEIQAPESLQSSWRDWFDRVGETITSVTAPKLEPEPEPAIEQEAEPEPIPEVEPANEQVLDVGTEEEEVNIPIHTIYRMPPKELMPRYVPTEDATEPLDEIRPVYRIRSRGRVGTALKAFLIIVALASAFVAGLGTGYIDKFLNSDTQVTTISGIIIHEK